MHCNGIEMVSKRVGRRKMVSTLDWKRMPLMGLLEVSLSLSTRPIPDCGPIPGDLFGVTNSDAAKSLAAISSMSFVDASLKEWEKSFGSKCATAEEGRGGVGCRDAPSR